MDLLPRKIRLVVVRSREEEEPQGASGETVRREGSIAPVWPLNDLSSKEEHLLVGHVESVGAVIVDLPELGPSQIARS